MYLICYNYMHTDDTCIVSHPNYQFIVMNVVADHTHFYCIFTVFDQKSTVIYCKFGW